MDDLSPPPGDSPADPAHQLWQLWRQGRPPEVPEFLAAHPDLPLTRCVGVLRVDQQERWLRGERVRAEDYLRRCPTLPEEYALDLVYSEFLLRERLGESPSLAEYDERFPQFAQRLRLQVEMHRALAASHPRQATAVGEAESEDRPTVPRAGSAPADATALPRVLGYEILGTLGRGGMGVVYKARHLRLRRVVALKMLRGDGAAGEELLARFRTESAALARLQHPNIVQVYEAGEHHGQPYLALEYVAGGGLDAQSAGTPQPASRAARLVEALARAVHYAHERGILHRDLKPHNVLLTEDGGLKVTDFGLAKLLAPGPGLSSLRYETQAGAILGTPSYMAPEQTGGAAAQAGPAADVYALGAILYELLTGRPPLQGANSLETLEQVRRQEPVPPRRLQPSVPRDLDAVCLRCLEKDPAQRYASAADLADDLGRFAAGRPTLARPPGRLGRAWRWCRRNPVVACLTAALALAVTTGFAVVVCLWWQAEEERAEALRQQAEAERQRELAAENVALGRQAVDRFCTTVSEERLLHEPAMEGLRRELLQGAVEFYEKFARQGGDRPVLRLDRALARLRLGNITSELGAKEEGMRLTEQGIKLLEGLRADKDVGRTARARLPHAYHALAHLCINAGLPERADALLRKALPLQEQLVQERPGEPEPRSELAALHLTLGGTAFGRARMIIAEAAFTRALDICERLARDHPDRAEYRGDLARSLVACAELYADFGRPGKAEPLARRCLDLFTEMGRHKPLTPRDRALAAGARRVLGRAHAARGRHREAVAAYNRAVDELDELVRAHPLRHNLRRMLAGTLSNLGRTYAWAAEPRESEAAYGRAEAVLRGLSKDDPLGAGNLDSLGLTCAQLGNLSGAEGRPEDAAAARARAAAAWEELAQSPRKGADGCRNRLIAHQRLGQYHGQAGRTKQADRAFRVALDAARELAEAAPDDPDAQRLLALSNYQLAAHYIQTNRPGEAEPLLGAAAAIGDRLAQSATRAPVLDDRGALLWIMLGRARQLAGKRNEAAEALDKGLALHAKLTRTRPDGRKECLDLALLWCHAGQAYLGLGRLPEARSALHKSLALWEELASQYPRDPEVVEPLARLYGLFGDHTPVLGEGEAAAWYGRSLGVLKDLREAWPNSPSVRTLLLQVYRQHAGTLMKQKRFAEAAEDCREALAFADPAVRDKILVGRLVSLTMLGEYTRAAEEVQNLTDRARLVPIDLRVLVWLHGAWSDMARRDTRLAAAERQANAERWGAEAVRILRQSHTAGHFTAAADFQWLEKNSDLDVLRRRADFQALLAEVRRARDAAAKGRAALKP
jgi:serine/threonine-protein kinase